MSEASLTALTAEGSNTMVKIPVTEVTSFPLPRATLFLKKKITRQIKLPDIIQMINGGTGPYHSSLLLITSGRD